MGHSEADLDSLGACLAVYAIGKSLGVKTKIIYDDSKVERQTKNAFKRMYKNDQIAEMTISPAKAVIEYGTNSLLVVVDVNDPDRVMDTAILKKTEKIIVIDHHRPGKKHFESTMLSFIDASASSTCELLAEMIRYGTRKVDVPSEIATLMLSGIMLDTNYYRKHTGPKTYDASYILKMFDADNVIADEFFKDQYEEYLLRLKIKANYIVPHTGVIICMGESKDYVDKATLAKVGDEMSAVAGVNLVFVLGETSENEVSISSRGDGTISCQLLCEKLGGGGHHGAAAVALSNTNIEDAKNRLLDVLNNYLDYSRVRKED